MKKDRGLEDCCDVCKSWLLSREKWVGLCARCSEELKWDPKGGKGRPVEGLKLRKGL